MTFNIEDRLAHLKRAGRLRLLLEQVAYQWHYFPERHDDIERQLDEIKPPIVRF